MRGFTLVLWLIATTLAAQEPVPTASESTRAESARSVAPPSLEQLRYLQGLRTAGRGIAQLKDAVNRVSSAHGNALRLKQAARRLGGLCGTARGFMTSGRAKMQPTAYQDSTRLKARRLTVQIDSIIRAAPTCEMNAARQPDSTVAGLLLRIRAYEAALRDFRVAVALPVR
jgi:hypothetical protein